jgi:A/G-specific adenine glycosylase
MPDLAALAAGWYDANARDLPWRAPDTSPWGVLVSEFMLQQTPVSRVLPVWHEWLDRWPAPPALAAEPSGEAIRAWGRLGYPRRALRLHECAVVVTRDHGGAVPSTVDELLALPGIGAYTARAVAAFAYRQRHPVVDTNVRRLVARAVAGQPDAGPTTTAADLVAVERLLPAEPEAAAHVSAAFMELGALVCVARTPRCVACPLAVHCAWRAGPGAAAGRPAERQPGEGRTRRRQTYAGTDRQVRGLLLAVLREATGPVPASRLDAVWPDATQRDRALSGLLADGLVCEHDHRRYVLPGTKTGSRGVARDR